MNIIKWRGGMRDSYGHVQHAELFVGLDIDGNEVYEGDRLIDQFGGEWKIELHVVLVGGFDPDIHTDLEYEDGLNLSLIKSDDTEDEDND